LGLKRHVLLLESRQRLAPIMWGTIHPRILLPESARDWPAEKRRQVLLHELAHVRRWDCATQTLAHLTCAIYWFNPLVWIADRAMRLEREQAADDEVVREGCSTADYAAHLVEIARSLQAPALPRFSTLAIIRQSRLSRRLRALLDPNRDHRRVDRGSAFAGFVVAVTALLPLSMLHGQPARPATKPSAPAAVEPAPVSRIKRLVIVTTGNYYVERAAASMNGQQVNSISPTDYERDGAPTADLIIFDRYTPPHAPAAPSIYFGAVPAGGRFKQLLVAGEPAWCDQIGVAEFDGRHPIMSNVSAARIYANEMLAIEPPPSATVLIRGDKGPMVIYDAGGPGTVCVTFDVLQSNWPLRVSFPLFVNNASLYLEGNRVATTRDSGSATQSAPVGEADIEPVRPQAQNTVRGYFSAAGRESVPRP
jgi:hypothetical protein